MTAILVGSVPVLSFGVAQVVTNGNAWAAGSTTCTGAPRTVTFASPGLSNLGAAQVKAKSKAKMTSGSITCTGGQTGSGTLAASKIKSKSTLLCQKDDSPPSPCPSGDYVYDSVGQFAAAFGSLYEDVKTTSWTIGSTSYVAANSDSRLATSGSGPGYCASGEIGFVLTGVLTAPASQAGNSTEITACFDTDSGTNTTGSFLNDVTSELQGNPSIIITSARFDASSSSILFT